MDVLKLGRWRGKGKTFKEFETISRFIGRGRGRGRAALPAQKIEDELSSTSSEEEVPKRLGRGRGRGRLSKKLESVAFSIRCGIGGRNAEISEGLKSAISAQEIDGIYSTSTVTWDPFTVLPKEIYLKIFDMLNDPNDKENFLNAHIKFYDLYKQDRPLFLFGNVLKTLAKNGNGIERERVPVNEWHKSFHYFNNYSDSNGLSDGDYLNLRLVCRDWDVAMQDYLQLHPSHFRLGGNKWEEKINSSLGMRIPIFEREWVFRKQFGDEWQRGPIGIFKVDVEHIKVTHPPSRNPFLTRNFRFKVFPYRHPEHDPKVDELLETYGHHIWHCNFIFDAVTRESFSQFLKWMSLMPELKTLEICRDKYARPWPLRNPGNNKLPEMAKLSVIKCYRFPLKYFNKLLKGIKGPLEKVLIDLDHQVSLQGYQLPSSLIEARLLIENQDIDYLQNKLFKTPPLLRKLTLNTTGQLFDYCDWEAVLKTVEKLFPQLEELNLELPDVNEYKEQNVPRVSLISRLNLPKMRKLRVVLSNLTSLDFLLPLKELEELQVIVKYVERDPDEVKELAKKEVIKFNLNFDRMCESNIWQVFPKLRKLHVKAVTRSSRGFQPRIRMSEGRDEIPTPIFSTPCVEHKLLWELYGYVKQGTIQKLISYNSGNAFYHCLDTRRRFEIVHKLFYMSHSEM